MHMYNNKYIIRLISYFLPKHAEIIEVGEDYKIPAIIEGDIDKDGANEILTLYRRDQKNYVLILKSFGKKWHVVWNNRTNYKEINKFELANLTPEYTQVALGGKIEEEEGYKLSLLNWKEESLQEMLSEPLPFDKIYIEDIDGEDGLDEIALWKHKVLEAYDIDLYRYKEDKLVEDKSLEKKYFKMVVNYYEYLHQMGEDGNIYIQYLEEAKRKCELEYKTDKEEEPAEYEAEEVGREGRTAEYEIEEVEHEEKLVEHEEKPVEYKAREVGREGRPAEYKAREVEHEERPVEYKAREVSHEERPVEMGSSLSKEVIVAQPAYLSEGVEEDIYLWGKRQGDWITDMKLTVTKGEKTRYNIIPIAEEKVYDYQLFVGDFTGNKLDNIWLGVKGSQEVKGMHVRIYSFEKGRAEVIWDSAEVQSYQGDWQEKEEIIEIYPVDKFVRGVYEICYKTTGKKVVWLRWEEGVFVPYNQYTIQS